MEVYLDNAATTRVCPEAADIAYKTMLECYGNPSSTHTKGREAKAVLDKARKQLAAALDCAPGEVYFTSCGSEGDNWAILNGAESMRRKGLHVISSEVEHDAVRKSVDELKRRGFEVTMLKPESDGSISPESVIGALRPDTVLVSLMMVNNEIGAVTDIAEIAKALKKAKSIALLHTDAVQGFMKVPFSAKRLGADMITVSGHKIHAPKGIGALYIKTGFKIKPYIIGGAQESGMRAGTEPMPQIAAFGAAAELAKSGMAENTANMAKLRQYTAERIVAEMPEAVIIGGGAPHILSVSLPGWRSEVLMNFLEARGIYISRSSACKKGGRSHVLEAMGLPAEVIDGAVRISLSRYTTKEELDELCSALKNAHDTIAHR
ncbi:MAG: cysteine desulfurase family protein [Oscillospiraceae bacterium]|nr:cysteine desulfurase family protein [Oscillospiraceae bacterium]